MPVPEGNTRILLHDADGTYALWRESVVLQVRSGRLTSQALQAIEPPLRALLNSGRPAGFLLVIEPGAPIPGDDVRPRQRALLETFLGKPTMRMAPIMLGDDVAASLARSAGRLVAVGNPNIQRFTTVVAGAQWLARELAAIGSRVSAAELVTAIERLREQHRAGSLPGPPAP
jgi:hypothetical protein